MKDKQSGKPDSSSYVDLEKLSEEKQKLIKAVLACRFEHFGPYQKYELRSKYGSEGSILNGIFIILDDHEDTSDKCAKQISRF